MAKKCNQSYFPVKEEISCFWWKSYAHFAHRVTPNASNDSTVCELFKLLRIKEVNGAIIDLDDFSAIPHHKDRLPNSFCVNKEALT